VNNVEVAKALERPPECEQLEPWGRAAAAARRSGRVWLGPAVVLGAVACHRCKCSSLGAAGGPRGDKHARSLASLRTPTRNPTPPYTHPTPNPSSLTPPLPDLLKFYGCELGAQTNFDKNTGTSIVNGAHDLRKLSELLEGFIKKYVQCYSCGNPETTIRVKKEFITLKCKACGAVRRGGGGGGVAWVPGPAALAAAVAAQELRLPGKQTSTCLQRRCGLGPRLTLLSRAPSPPRGLFQVSDVDMRHKLNTFILKNPPENKLSKEEKRQAAGRLAGEVGLRRSVDERLAQGRGVAAGRRPHLILVAGNSHPPSGVAAVQWHAMR
jgi:translation initiation factor 2 beta subunit (eIF-2beta)/eIF-5